MKLPGWEPVGGSSGRYIDPSGAEVSRRSYLNAQAQTVGYHNYGEFQRLSKNPVYANAVAAAENPKEARKLDSAFNSTFAKSIQPHWRKGERASKAAWEDSFDALDLE